VRKVEEQITAFVSLLEYAPGEQRRSGSALSLQPLVFVRGASSTVLPTSISGVLFVVVDVLAPLIAALTVVVAALATETESASASTAAPARRAFTTRPSFPGGNEGQ
jgi:hypothetical protein